MGQVVRDIFDSLPARTVARDDTKSAMSVMPIPSSKEKSFSVSRVYDVSFEAVAADLSWRNPIINGNEDTQWKFLQENVAEAKVGDQRLFEAEYPGLGHIRVLQRLCKVVRKERSMELEVEIVHGSIMSMSGMTEPRWRMLVVAASDDASKACVEYTMTWQGEDCPDSLLQAIRDNFESLPTRAVTRDNTKWALPVMPVPSSEEKSFSFSRVYDVSFEAVAADLSWRNPIINGSEDTQWKFLQENVAEPQVGDQRLFEAEYPGLGHVRHMERLRKVVHEERIMELEVEVLENSLMTDVSDQRFRMVVVAASDDASKACLEYTFTWRGMGVPDSLLQAVRDLFDSLPLRTAAAAAEKTK